MTRQPQLGVVEYLGEYSCASEKYEHHILLEYGELDLDDYFSLKLPPTMSEEIISFWESVFQIAKAIEKIHHFQHRDHDGNVRNFSGQVTLRNWIQP